jgi:hypothetical protein
MKTFKFYPATILMVINALVSTGVAFGLNWDKMQVAWTSTIATAVLAIITAALARPVPIPVITGAFGTILVGVGAFGFKLRPDQIVALTTIVSIGVGFLTHQLVTPNAGSPTNQPLPATE